MLDLLLFVPFMSFINTIGIVFPVVRYLSQCTTRTDGTASRRNNRIYYETITIFERLLLSTFLRHLELSSCKTLFEIINIHDVIMFLAVTQLKEGITEFVRA